MRSASAVVLLVTLAVVAPGVAVATDSPAVTTTSAWPSEPSSVREGGPVGLQRPDPYMVMNVTVTADGDARWRVTSRYFVRTKNRTVAFKKLLARVKAGETTPGYSADTFRRFSTLAENATDRDVDMRIVDANWSGEIDNDTARLILTFTWTDFARVDGSQVIVQDAFYSPNGTWLPRLGDGQRLVINAPPGYSVDSVSFPVSNGTMVLDGPRTFSRGDIRAVYVPTSPGTTTTTTTSTNTSTAPPPTGQDVSPLFWVGLLLLIVAVGAGGYLLARRNGEREPSGESPAAEANARGESATESPESTEAPSGADAGAGADVEGAEADRGAAESQAEDAAAAETTETAEPETEVDEAEADDAEAEAEQTIDPELLSDEERVERLLQENGGRMKQANIVSETGWSNAKVSQLLSSMDEDDRIDKLRIGRENLITLPDEDVADFDDH